MGSIRSFAFSLGKTTIPDFEKNCESTPFPVNLIVFRSVLRESEAMTDYLASEYPVLARRLKKTPLAELPTPVDERRIVVGSMPQSVATKHDDLTGTLYGGNKLRKLEYILQRATARQALRVATFGTVGSNHALATALYANQLGFECTCFLSHQTRTPGAAMALNMHLQNRTEIVRFGGSYRARIDTMRRYLQNRRAWVIPLGGSSWLGAVGFVNAGLELAAQVAAGEIRRPDRLYVAMGTMGTAVGLALGLALAGLETEIQAIRVAHETFANRDGLQRLLKKTASLLHRIDPSIPADLAGRTQLQFRDEFFGDGYAQSNSDTEHAIDFAADEMGLTLEATYTGKAMAALLHDLAIPALAGRPVLFWNTYNSHPLPVSCARPSTTSDLPDEFLRYFD